MTKAKSREVTRIGGIASEYGNDHSCIILPRSFLGKRVFALLKEDYDKMRRQEELKNNAQIGKFASALVSQGNQHRSRKQLKTEKEKLLVI